MFCFNEELELTRLGQQIIDAVISERIVKIGGMTLLLSRAVGENQLLQVTPEILEIWRREVLDEALRRMNEADMSLYRQRRRIGTSDL